MIELKKCPFCGGEAKVVRLASLHEEEPQATIMDRWCVRCKDCMCSTGTFKDEIHRKSTGELVVEADGVSKAVNAWNTRATAEEEGTKGIFHYVHYEN